MKPNIILYDIETTHNLAAIFRLFEDYTSHENIIQERYIVSIAWKELGEKTVHSVSVLDNPKLYKKDPHNDKHVIETFIKVLENADCIIGHNADAYDLKFFEGRMLFHGFSALPPIPSIDTLKVAKSRLLLNSNKLDYLGRYLKVGKKISTKNELWLRVLQGDKKAVQEMVEYNEYDVTLLEKVFLKLRPYTANYINRQLFGGEGCPRCGSKHVQSRGVHHAITRSYRRYQCQACKGWFKSQKPIGESTASRVL